VVIISVLAKLRIFVRISDLRIRIFVEVCKVRMRMRISQNLTDFYSCRPLLQYAVKALSGNLDSQNIRLFRPLSGHYRAIIGAEMGRQPQNTLTTSGEIIRFEQCRDSCVLASLKILHLVQVLSQSNRNCTRSPPYSEFLPQAGNGLGHSAIIGPEWAASSRIAHF
jgi:hypothetical protein